MTDHDSKVNWEPFAAQQVLQARANLYALIRDFFTSRDVLEVETPIIQATAVTDLHIESINVLNADSRCYLHTSPEYFMKRILAYHKQDIYQICKTFRAGEKGRYHHFEFTMLEWYRVDWDYKKLMYEVDELIRFLSTGKIELTETIFFTYQEIFIKYCGVDPFQVDQSDYIKICKRANISINAKLSNQGYQVLLLDQLIAPQLPKNQMVFIYDFPVQQAALARINENGVAERFELYFGGIELANGFQELTDADEQLLRFEADNMKRKENNKKQISIDKKFIAALKTGLPESSGVALGIDRLLMILLGVNEINQVLAFPDL